MATAGLKRPRPTYGGSIENDVSVEDRICPFCSKGHAEGLEFSRSFIDILTDSNVWASDKPTFVTNGKSFWAHSVCVHHSPQTFYDENTLSWQYVSKEYFRARCLICAACGKKGASIGCKVSSCNASCHFPCATKERLPNGEKNWFPCQDPNMPFFCLAHKDERAEYERGKEISRLADLSQGKESKPIPLKLGYAQVEQESAVAAQSRGHSNDAASLYTRAQWNILLPEVPLPSGILSTNRNIDFRYVESTVDSKSAKVKQGPEGKKRCCLCVGPNACRDPRKCECLRDGRNYRWKGRRLDHGHPSPIYECNLNCSCHLGSCRNRLVQKSMVCSIDVAYLGPSRRLLEGCDKNWGVRAADDIPVGTFVCTVAGQLVLGCEIEGFNIEGQHSSILVHRVRDWAGDASSRDVSGSGPMARPGPAQDQEVFLDQRRFANISRYIRCVRREDDANLLRATVHTANQDPAAPVLALFACMDIAKGIELVRSR